MSLNRFKFLGRLTKDVEYKILGETKVASFSVAVNRRFVGQNGERQADFFNLTAFGKTAEICANYLKKGYQVLVEGRMQNETWEDQTGAKRYATKFMVEQVYLLDNKKSEQAPQATDTSDFITIEETDDLPF